MGDVPAPAPVPEPEPVVEVDVEKLVEDDESEKYPKKWTFGDKR